MGTEIAVSFTALRAQLENEKSSLYKIDENIKKIVQTTGRFSNDRFNSSGDYTRGGQRQGRFSYPDAGGNYKNDELFNKRKPETKTVFSRLSGRANDSDGEDDGPGTKKARVPSAVCRELPTRAAVLRAQGDDEQARKRNRRIFGSLLGTLQKFRQEEIVLQTKEDKKALVERKIEEQARLEKEREQKERKTLFAEREHKKATIKALEAKMGRVQEFEKWEESQKCLAKFILTKAKPHIYWLPKKMSDKAQEKLDSSRKYHEKCMMRKREQLQDELQRIEQRCMRPRGPGAKENDPEILQEEDDITLTNHKAEDKEEDRGRKRDKFAMDVDDKEKEDSDVDERHDDERNDVERHDNGRHKSECHDDERYDDKRHDDKRHNDKRHDNEHHNDDRHDDNRHNDKRQDDERQDGERQDGERQEDERHNEDTVEERKIKTEDKGSSEIKMDTSVDQDKETPVQNSKENTESVETNHATKVEETAVVQTDVPNLLEPSDHS